MIYATTVKDSVSVQPQARINNAAVTCASIDRKGFDYSNVKLILGANDIGLTVCKLQESDDNSTWTDVPGGDFSTSGTLPGASDQNKVYVWDADLRARKRYLRPALTVGNGVSGAFVAVIAQLSRAEQSPRDAASRGAAQVLSI